MSIATKLTYLNTTKGKIKDSINLTGANIGNNDTFRSYAVKLRDGLLNVLNNGTIVLYNNFPKVSGTGSNISLKNTLEAPMFMNKFDGDTLQQEVPSEYTQVDYIESSGTQYINTDYQITSTTNIEIKTNSGGSATQVFGVEANNIGYILTAGHWRIFSTSGYRNINYLDIYEFKTDGSKVYLKNGTLVVDCEATPVNIPNYNLYLFARNVSGTPNYGSNAKIYYFKIYDNGILVRHFVPCYRNSDNEVGMYDLVNNVFYTNQGTGSFTYGAVVPSPDSPLEIQSVEGIQNVNVCGKNLFDKNNITSHKTFNASGKIIDLASSFIQEKYIPVSSSTQYTISTTNSYVSTTDYRLMICEYDENKNFIQRTLEWQSTYKTITTTANTKYVRLCASNVTIDELQFEKGVKTSYEAYTGNTYEVNLGNNLLQVINQNFSISGVSFKANNGNIILNGTATTTIYGGSYRYDNMFPITLEAGTYTISRKKIGSSVGLIDNNGNTHGQLSSSSSALSVTFTLNNQLNCYLFFYIPSSKNFDNEVFEIQIEKGETATSYLPYISTIKLYNGDYITGTPDNWSVVRNNGVIESYNGETITTEYISTTGGLDTGATIVYKLNTPTTEQITDTYLISQLNALYNAKSKNGQTNITVDGQLPMILNVSALKGE